MADDGAEQSRPPGFIRATLREQARLARIRPIAPPALLFRVGRWWTRTVLRESSPQIAIGALVVAVVLFALGAEHALVGVIVLVLLALIAIWEAWAAWLAHRSTQRIEEALEGIDRVGRRHVGHHSRGMVRPRTAP